MQADEENFLKKETGWLFDDCGIVPNENLTEEDLS